MTSASRVANPGLDGVVVADTEISEVDGERGRLVIAGADVEQLAASTGFEGAARAVLAAGGADPAALGDAEGPLRAWFAEVSKSEWKTMIDIKRQYVTASVVDNERVVFNVGGNKYRLVVKLWFPGQVVWIKFIGTHASYDRIDVKKL